MCVPCGQPYRANTVPGSRLTFSAAVTQIVALTDPFSPVSPAGSPVLPVEGIFPFNATSMRSPAAQWNLGFGTLVSTPFFFFDFVGRVSLVENVKVVLDPFAQLIDDVPLVEPVKLNLPVPGALGEGEQRLTETVPATLPLKVAHEPFTGLGLGVFADATPGTNTARASAGMLSTEMSATRRVDRDRCMGPPFVDDVDVSCDCKAAACEVTGVSLRSVWDVVEFVFRVVVRHVATVKVVTTGCGLHEQRHDVVFDSGAMTRNMPRRHRSPD
jgi:hypothetical protein